MSVSRAGRRDIEAWIGQEVAVNYRGGYLTGVLADVGYRGLILRESGPWRGSVRLTRWVPHGAVLDVILASSLPINTTDHRQEGGDRRER